MIEIRKSEFAKKGHEVILEKLLKLCNRQGLQEGGITRILDAGSGRTSLKEIQKAFPAAQVDAVVYPGDERKLKSIEPYLTEQVRVLECDICETSFEKSYDLVVAHLLLGEAGKFGNTFDKVLSRLLAIDSLYFILIDYVEDPEVNEENIREICVENSYEILQQVKEECSEPQTWRDFTGYHNFGYLIYNLDQ